MKDKIMILDLFQKNCEQTKIYYSSCYSKKQRWCLNSCEDVGWWFCLNWNIGQCHLKYYLIIQSALHLLICFIWSIADLIYTKINLATNNYSLLVEVVLHIWYCKSIFWRYICKVREGRGLVNWWSFLWMGEGGGGQSGDSTSFPGIQN